MEQNLWVLQLGLSQQKPPQGPSAGISHLQQDYLCETKHWLQLGPAAISEADSCFAELYTTEGRNSKPQVGCESTQAQRQQRHSLKCRKPTAKYLFPDNTFWVPISHHHGVKQSQSITSWHLGEFLCTWISREL